jgi:hypothetical protein
MSEAERTLRRLLIEGSKRAALGGVVAGTAMTAALTISGAGAQQAAGTRAPSAIERTVSSIGRGSVPAPAAPTNCTQTGLPQLNPPSSVNPPCAQAPVPPILGIGAKKP